MSEILGKIKPNMGRRDAEKVRLLGVHVLLPDRSRIVFAWGEGGKSPAHMGQFIKQTLTAC